MFRLGPLSLPAQGSIRKLGICALVVFWLLFFSSVGRAFDAIQITDNSTHDMYPAISGSNVVWMGCDGGSGTTCDGGDWEIYFWDGATTTQVTFNDRDDKYPSISGSNVVWTAPDGPDDDVFLWDGSTITQITDNSSSEHRPEISGSSVVWYASYGDFIDGYEVYLWDGFHAVPITHNDIDDVSPSISGSNVAWAHCDGVSYPSCLNDGDLEIYLWDGASATQITDNSVDDRHPAISGSNVAWERAVGALGGRGAQIYARVDGATIQVTDGSYDYAPAISGSNVVWYGSDGTNKSEIYLWTAGTTVPITDNSVSDMYPAISGANVVWMRDDGNDYEIYMSTFTTPVPVPSISFGGLALLAGLVICFVAWARRGG